MKNVIQFEKKISIQIVVAVPSFEHTKSNPYRNILSGIPMVRLLALERKQH